QIVVEAAVARVGFYLSRNLRPVGVGRHQSGADRHEQGISIAGADRLLGYQLRPAGDIADGLCPDRAAQPSADCDCSRCRVGVVEALEYLPNSESNTFVGGPE